MRWLLKVFNNWRSNPNNILISVLCMVGGLSMLALFVLYILTLTGCNDPEDSGIYPSPSGKGVIVCGEAIVINDDERTYEQIETEFEYLMTQRAMYCLPMRDQANL